MCTLTPLTDETIGTLLESLKSNIPDSIHAYCFVRALVQCKSAFPELDINVFAPDGDISDHTFLLYIDYYKKWQFLTIYSSTDKGIERLKQSLETCKFIDWKRYFLFTCVPTRISTKLEPLWDTLGIKVGQDPGKTYWMPSDEIKALPTKIIEDVEIGPLSQKDAKLINSVWPHRIDGTEQMIGEFIKLFFGLGLFKKDSGNLVSWGLHWFYGGIGLLQTVEEEQGKGYGQAVSIEICKKLDREGWPVHLIVVKGNKQGERLFKEKLKFSFIHENVWIHSNSV